MHKHHNWNKKQLENQLTTLIPFLDKNMTTYHLKEDIFLSPPFILSNKEHITNTITTFHSYRDTFLPLDYWLSLKPFFEKLRKFDTTMQFDGKYQLYHTYRLLSFINTYLSAIGLYLSGELKPKTVAHLNGVQAELLSKSIYHRNYAYKDDTFFKRFALLESIIFRKYYYHKEATDHFINTFTLIPPHQIKNLQNNSIETIFINRMISYFGTTNISSEVPILKSLAIVMAYYMFEKMKMTKKDIINLLKEFFDYYINYDEDEEIIYSTPDSFSELTKNVYIKHRINLIPIFGSSKNSIDLKIQKFNELNWLFEDFEKEQNHKFPKGFIKDFNLANNPVLGYLNHNPMELLQEKL